MSERELIEPHAGDKRYMRRDAQGRFDTMFDAGRSLAQDVRHHSDHKKPRNQGDRGD